MATITGTLAGSLKQGDSVFITTTSLDMSDYDDTDVFYVPTQPLYGQLWIAGRQLITGDIFTRNELVLGTLEYRHLGESDDADSFGIMIRNGETGSYTYGDESTFDVTIASSNEGWFYAVHLIDAPTKLVAWCDAKWKFGKEASRWAVTHYGGTSVIEVTAEDEVSLLELLLTKNDTRNIDREANSEVGTVNTTQVNAVWDRLIIS